MGTPQSGAQAPARTDDLPEVHQLSSERRRALQEHQCSVCGLPIAIGSTYERILTKDLEALNPKKSLRVIKWHLPHCPKGEV